MSTTLALTTLLMGLAGGGHCLAMCGPACGALTAAGQDPAGTAVVRMRTGASAWQRIAALQAGRLLGYMVAGAAVATAMQSLAWMTNHTAALRPLWTLAHLAALVWGAMLLLQARQPAWVERLGHRVWHRIAPLARSPARLGVAGACWAFMPCGLLYSALLSAALSGGAADGALAMLGFGIGTTVWLVAGPWLWVRLRSLQALRLPPASGVRLAGAALCATAGWALWMDVQHRVALWC